MTKRRTERLGVREGYDRWSETYDATPNPLVALDETVVFEPVGCVSSALLASDAPARSFDPFARRIALDERTRFTPVMKFVRSAAGYDVHRMTYRGDGGWSWPHRFRSTRHARHVLPPAHRPAEVLRVGLTAANHTLRPSARCLPRTDTSQASDHNGIGRRSSTDGRSRVRSNIAYLALIRGGMRPNHHGRRHRHGAAGRRNQGC